MAPVSVLLLIFVASSGLTLSIADTFDVTRYGAVGDGKTDDTQAFLKAWKAACGATGRRTTLKVPSRKTFFLNPLMFMGPCKSSAIKIQIDGNLIAPGSKNAWKNCDDNTWIIINSVYGLNIQGTGTLDAKGSSWWGTGKAYDMGDDGSSNMPTPGACQKPATFRLANCNNTQMRGLSFLNSGGNHISIVYCNDLNINKINIKAPENSPNTDGIDMIGSRNVIIRDSKIRTGDDCIAINTNCFNVNISGIICGPGHGISIGSLGKDGAAVAVDGIYIQHCTFTKTLSSARIKTCPGGTGYAKNIYYNDITLNDVYRSIDIEQHYSGSREKRKAVQISRVHFTNMHGTGEQILLDCSQHVPCRQIYLHKVNITSPIPGKKVDVTCKHANIRASSVTPHVSCKK